MRLSSTRSPFDNSERQAFTLTPLDFERVAAARRGEHYIAGWLTGDPRCLNCGASWADADAWARDVNAARCTGLPPAVDPVPGAQAVSVGGM